jgi:hypothetical protein
MGLALGRGNRVDADAAAGVHLALRQAEGFATSVLRLLGQELRVPDHATLSRRNRSFAGLAPGSSRTARCIW